MTEIAEMTDDDIIHVDDVDGVAPAFLATFVIVVGGDAGDQNVADFILTRATHHTWIASDARHVVMSWMVVADGDDGGTDFPQGALGLRREWICDKTYIFATQLKAGVAQPGYFHFYNFAFLISSGGD